MSRPRKELRPSDITAIVDTREQLPWTLTPLKTVRGTLGTGDYSVMGLERAGVAIERKSLSDLAGCIGGSRKRFDDCIRRLKSYECSAVIVEASWRDLETWELRSGVSKEAAMGSVLGWMAEGVPFVFAGNAEQASLAAARMMFIAARRKFAELGAFYESLKVVE